MVEDPNAYESFYINFMPLPDVLDEGGSDPPVIQTQKYNIKPEDVKEFLEIGRDDINKYHKLKNILTES